MLTLVTLSINGVMKEIFELLVFIINNFEYIMLGIGVIILCYLDFRYHKIYDCVQLLVLVAGILQFDNPTIIGTVIGPIIGYMLSYKEYSKGVIGFGDVKLFVALGTWTGILGMIFVFLISEFFFKHLIIFYNVFLNKRQKNYPFGPPIAVSAVLYLCLFNNIEMIINQL